MIVQKINERCVILKTLRQKCPALVCCTQVCSLHPPLLLRADDAQNPSYQVGALPAQPACLPACLPVCLPAPLSPFLQSHCPALLQKADACQCYICTPCLPHLQIIRSPLLPPPTSTETFKSTIWGPTCDSADCVYKVRDPFHCRPCVPTGVRLIQCCEHKVWGQALSIKPINLSVVGQHVMYCRYTALFYVAVFAQ